MLENVIKRPIATSMVFLALILLGIASLPSLPISLLPNVEIGEINILIDGEDIGRLEMENKVIAPLRRKLLHLNGLEDIKSVSTDGKGKISLLYSYGINMQLAYIETNEHVDMMMPFFPKGIKRPQVSHTKANDFPIIKLIVQKNKGVNRDTEISRFCKEVLRRRFEQLQGVSYVDITGLNKREILIEPDSDRLYSSNINLEDIALGIKNNNYSDINLEYNEQDYVFELQLSNRIHNLEEIEFITIKKDNKIFFLKDLARVSYAQNPDNGFCLYNSIPSVCLDIIMQPKTKISTLQLEIEEIVSELSNQYPEIKIIPTQDQSKLLEFSIKNLTQSLLLSIIFSFIFLFLFIRNFKPSLLIGIIIPVTLAICPLFFNLFNLSINIISLSGLILAVGMMIDNSIIVIDNINNKHKNGVALELSCSSGSKEVSSPILSSVLTTCSVFFPLVYLSGLAGVLFFEQAMAIAIGLIVSYFVAIFLLPVMYLQLHKIGTTHYQNSRSKVKRIYDSCFWILLRNKKILYIALIGVTIFGMISFGNLSRRKLPKLEGKECMFLIEWDSPVCLQENKKRILNLGDFLHNFYDECFVLGGDSQYSLNLTPSGSGNQSFVYFRVKENHLMGDFKDHLSKWFAKYYPDTKVTQEKSINFLEKLLEDKNSFLEVNFSGINYDTIVGIIDSVKKNPSIIDYHSSSSYERRILINVDQNLLEIYDVDYGKLINQLKVQLGGFSFTSLSSGTNLIPIVLKSAEKQSEIHNIHIQNNKGKMIPLNSISTIKPVSDLKSIIGGKDGQYYSLDIDQLEGSVEGFINNIKKMGQQVKNLSIRFSGEWFILEKLIRELLFVMLIAILLLYFILAMQFESLILPFIILIEIPIDIALVFIAMNIFEVSVNVLSLIGIIVMAGIIINDSILKISTINNLYRKGYSLIYSVHHAGEIRLNSILTTSLTTIFALLPVVWGSGLGNQLQYSLAFTIIVGLVFGTLVSVFLIPLLYIGLIKTQVKFFKLLR